MERLERHLLDLREYLLRYEEQSAGPLAQVHAMCDQSAQNLVHYSGLRTFRAAELSRSLEESGLASLEGAPSHVLARVELLLNLVRALRGRTEPLRPRFRQTIDAAGAQNLLQLNVEALLGPAPRDRRTRILSTIPQQVATDAALAEVLVRHGLDCGRIDCGRDDPVRWAAMIESLRRAARAAGRPCRILMDLAGPRLRTGPLPAGPPVVRLQPQRDPVGRPVAPARIWFTRREAPEEPIRPADAVLPVPGSWLDRLRRGDPISFVDLRGKRRQMRVVQGGAGGWWAELGNAAYVGTGTRLRIRRPGGRMGDPSWMADVGDLPATELPLLLRQGDRLRLTAGPTPSVLDNEVGGAEPSITCTMPEVLADVRPGDRIWFDDGELGGVVREATPSALRIEITWARPHGTPLGSNAAIRLPDTPMRAAFWSETDASILSFAVQHADALVLPPVRHPRDVQQVQDATARCGGRHLGIVLRIEHRCALDGLLPLLLQALRTHPTGVLFELRHLAIDVQDGTLEERLDAAMMSCRAAHLPVLWNTPTLESWSAKAPPTPAELVLAVTQLPSDGLVLGSGPHLPDALARLDEALRRREGDRNRPENLPSPIPMRGPVGRL